MSVILTCWAQNWQNPPSPWSVCCKDEINQNPRRGNQRHLSGFISVNVFQSTFPAPCSPSSRYPSVEEGLYNPYVTMLWQNSGRHTFIDVISVCQVTETKALVSVVSEKPPWVAEHSQSQSHPMLSWFYRWVDILCCKSFKSYFCILLSFFWTPAWWASKL